VSIIHIFPKFVGGSTRNFIKTIKNPKLKIKLKSKSTNRKVIIKSKMSSKDIIINKVLASIVKQKIEKEAYVCRLVSYYSCEYKFCGIQSIHGINCNIMLRFCFDYDKTEFSTVLIIYHDDMYSDEQDEFSLYLERIGTYEKLNTETLSTVLDDMKTELSKLHFSLFSGEFINKPSTIFQEMEFFQDIPSIKTMGEECPVCQDCITITKTYCGHTLCIPCFQTIKKGVDDDGDDIKKCPICRKHITYVD